MVGIVAAHAAEQVGEALSIGLSDPIQQGAPIGRQAGGNHPAIIRMRPAARPAVLGQDIDVQRRRAPRHRERSRQLGRGDAVLTASLDLEERRGLIKILAEPSILAMSGEQGEFLAGGKVFIPVTQIGAVGSGSNWVSLEEREFGVGLKFLPTVLSRDRIRLKVSALPAMLTLDPRAVKEDCLCYLMHRIGMDGARL